MCKSQASIRQSNGHSLVLKRAMRLSLEQQGVQQKAMALDLKVEDSTLSRYLSPDSAHCLPIDLLPVWVESAGDASVLRTLAARCGYEIHLDSHLPIRPEAVQQLSVLLARHSGDALGNLVQSLADGVITEDERINLAPDLLRLQATVNALVERVQA